MNTIRTIKPLTHLINNEIEIEIYNFDDCDLLYEQYTNEILNILAIIEYIFGTKSSDRYAFAS